MAMSSEPADRRSHLWRRPNWAVPRGAVPGAQTSRKREDMTPREQRAALLRLLLIVVAGLVVAQLAGVLATVLVVAALLVIIVLHELGHFATAKWSGMKVSEFFVGFGPRLWAVKRGETTYGVKALPLGGYCRIIGMTSAEEVEPEDEPRAYRNQATWKRVVVAMAGSTVHFVLALALLVVLFMGPGDTGNFVQSNPPATAPIAAVNSFTRGGESPAQKAHLVAGDRILAIDGRHFATWAQMSSYLKARPGRDITLTVDDKGHIFRSTTRLVDGSKVVPEGYSQPLFSRRTGFLGIAVSNVTRFGFIGAVEHAGTAFGSTVAQSVTRIGSRVVDFGSYIHMLASQKAADNPHAVRFVSPVGYVRMANVAASLGWSEVLYLLILINIFVGVFNLVPLLPLDGGHVAIALYEKVRSLGKRAPYHADVNKLAPVLYAVLAVLAFYSISSLFLDIRDIVS